ncbi:MAG: toprim domain-containing protein [Ilumatobacteraceae bacterium]
MNRYARDRGVLKEKDENPTGADVRQGLIAVVSLMLPDPSYDSQSKNRLETVPAAGVVESVVYEQITKWLEENPGPAKKVAEKAVSAMRDRKKTDEDRAADKSLARKSPLKGSGLPDKLYDCQLSPNAAATAGFRTELILVEGDSAGGTAVDARDPRYQAILPLRGKVLNVESASGSKIVGNQALATLIVAIGAGRGADFDIERMRYHDVVLLADADVDGQHITVLLITFFWRQMPELVRAGRLLVAQPPLFTTNTSDGKQYFTNDAAKDQYMAEHPGHKAPWNRLKGLGEMDSEDLTMVLHPGSRRMMQVSVEDAIALDDTLSPDG